MSQIETVKIKTTPSTVEQEKRIAESRNETLEDHLLSLLFHDAERTLGYSYSILESKKPASEENNKSQNTNSK